MSEIIPVNLKIRSTQTSPEDPDEKLCINLSCAAQMERRGDRLYLKYKEDVSGEGDRVNNVLSFDKKEPNVVSLVRTGNVGMSCVFESGKRFSCTYDLKFATMDFVIYTKAVKNTLTEEKGGEITVKYTIESRGIVFQETDYFIKVEK